MRPGSECRNCLEASGAMTSFLRALGRTARGCFDDRCATLVGEEKFGRRRGPDPGDHAEEGTGPGRAPLDQRKGDKRNVVPEAVP